MKAGLLNKNCIIMRKTVITGDYRDREVWEEHFRTKCQFIWNSGNRQTENNEIFYSNVATVVVRSYVDVQDEDHILIDNVEWRILAINRQNDTQHNCITINVEKINK